MASAVRKSKMKEVPLSEVKDDLSRYLREAETQDVVITRHGKPAGVLIGFKSEDDWFEYRLENDPRFLERVAQARASIRSGRGVKLEDVKQTVRSNSRLVSDKFRAQLRRARFAPHPGRYTAALEPAT
jgi:prevent-host-death family protein